jgi:HAD superfamily hydrolase (TIGR01450 family)
MINLMRKRSIPVIVANTDMSYPVSKHEVAVAIGGIAHMAEHIVGKRFIRFGKPDSQMFIFAYEHIQQFRQLEKEEILMVGDTLMTDIIGGNKFGLDTALVLTGNTLPERAKELIRSTGIIPDYVCESAVIEPQIK